MKTLIINGSPRKNGDTVALLKEFMKYLNGEIHLVNAYYDAIKPCFDCRYCWSNIGCSIKDDEMSTVYDWVQHADNFVIASPIYFSQPTGQLSNVFSRFQSLYCNRVFQNLHAPISKKNGVSILVGGGDGSHLPAQATIDIIFRQTNTQCISKVTSLTTNILPASNDTEALKSVKNAALQLNSCYSLKHSS